MEVSSNGDLATIFLTCIGNLKDPTFPGKLDQIKDKLKLLVSNGKRPFHVIKVEPWNSVRITFNISLEAAQRLRQLALRGDVNLRDLGILSVQLQGDQQAISLRVANNLNQSRELLVRNRDEESSNDLSASTPPSSLSSPSSPSSSSSSMRISQSVNLLIGNNVSNSGNPLEVPNVNNPNIACSSSGGSLSIEGTRRNIAEYLSRQPGNNETTTSTSTASSQEKNPFRPPNVIAPKNDKPLRSVPSNSSSSSTCLNTPSTSASSPTVPLIKSETLRSNLNSVDLIGKGGRSKPNQSPLPFASMQHVRHTKQGTSSSRSNTMQQSRLTNCNSSGPPSSPLVNSQDRAPPPNRPNSSPISTTSTTIIPNSRSLTSSPIKAKPSSPGLPIKQVMVSPTAALSVAPVQPNSSTILPTPIKASSNPSPIAVKPATATALSPTVSPVLKVLPVQASTSILPTVSSSSLPGSTEISSNCDIKSNILNASSSPSSIPNQFIRNTSGFVNSRNNNSNSNSSSPNSNSNGIPSTPPYPRSSDLSAPPMGYVPGTITQRSGSSESISANVASTSPLLVNLLQSDNNESHRRIRHSPPLPPPPPPPSLIQKSKGKPSLSEMMPKKSTRPRKPRKVKDKSLEEKTIPTPTSQIANSILSATDTPDNIQMSATAMKGKGISFQTQNLLLDESNSEESLSSVISLSKLDENSRAKHLVNPTTGLLEILCSDDDDDEISKTTRLSLLPDTKLETLASLVPNEIKVESNIVVCSSSVEMSPMELTKKSASSVDLKVETETSPTIEPFAMEDMLKSSVGLIDSEITKVDLKSTDAPINISDNSNKINTNSSDPIQKQSSIAQRLEYEQHLLPQQTQQKEQQESEPHLQPSLAENITSKASTSTPVPLQTDINSESSTSRAEFTSTSLISTVTTSPQKPSSSIEILMDESYSELNNINQSDQFEIKCQLVETSAGSSSIADEKSSLMTMPTSPSITTIIKEEQTNQTTFTSKLELTPPEATITETIVVTEEVHIEPLLGAKEEKDQATKNYSNNTAPTTTATITSTTTSSTANASQKSTSPSLLKARVEEETVNNNKENYHSSDTDSGIGKLLNDASSQSSFEASNSGGTPPSEIVPSLDEIENNSPDQIPVEVELPDSELVNVDLTIKCEDSFFDVDEISLPKVLPDLSNSPSANTQDAMIDLETIIDDMGHSVACGDHNYTSVKSPCISNDQDLDFNLDEEDDKNDDELESDENNRTMFNTHPSGSPTNTMTTTKTTTSSIALNLNNTLSTINTFETITPLNTNEISTRLTDKAKQIINTTPSPLSSVTVNCTINTTTSTHQSSNSAPHSTSIVDGITEVVAASPDKYDESSTIIPSICEDQDQNLIPLNNDSQKLSSSSHPLLSCPPLSLSTPSTTSTTNIVVDETSTTTIMPPTSSSTSSTTTTTAPSSPQVPLTRPRRNQEITRKSVRTTNTTTNPSITSKLRRRKINDEPNSLSTTSILIRDGQLSVDEISVHMPKKARLRSSKTDLTNNNRKEDEPVKKPILSRSKRINCKDAEEDVNYTLSVS